MVVMNVAYANDVPAFSIVERETENWASEEYAFFNEVLEVVESFYKTDFILWSLEDKSSNVKYPGVEYEAGGLMGARAIENYGSLVVSIRDVLLDGSGRVSQVTFNTGYAYRGLVREPKRITWECC